MKTMLKIIFVIFVSAIFLWVIMFSVKTIPISRVTVTDEPIVITDDTYHPSNYRQCKASVQMIARNGKLYVYRFPSDEFFSFDKHTEWLSVFENGELKRIKRIYDFSFMSDDYVYYGKEGRLLCYNIADGSESPLPSDTPRLSRHLVLYSEDGTVFYPKEPDLSTYSAIRGAAVESDSGFFDQYTLNSKVYRVEGTTFDGQEIVCYSDTTEPQTLDITYGQKSLIPCEGGILVHNEGLGDLLYYIDGDSGECRKLFSVECMSSVSAVTVYNNCVYLSLMRYEGYGSGYIGLKRYENDTIEGTYRINLDDFSAEKISSSIYNGLYIFDHTGIYACDENSDIYKLDFDGNVVLRIIS